jgi:putative ABC transport system permease protein
MWKNYFKIAFRNLRKNSVFSIVNILGIALSISAFVLMLEYMSFEQGVTKHL